MFQCLSVMVLRGPEPTTERDIGLVDGPLKAQPSMGGAVDARGTCTAGLAECAKFKAGCWGEEELDPRAFLALVARQPSQYLFPW